jgi:hypothetical protein
VVVRVQVFDASLLRFAVGLTHRLDQQFDKPPKRMASLVGEGGGLGLVGWLVGGWVGGWVGAVCCWWWGLGTGVGMGSVDGWVGGCVFGCCVLVVVV